MIKNLKEMPIMNEDDFRGLNAWKYLIEMRKVRCSYNINSEKNE